MSSQQLKDLFEAGLASPAADTIDVDAAIARGRGRRRTRVGATVLASAAAVVVAGLLVAGVLPPRSTGSVAPGDGTPLPIPTSQWKDGDAGMAALLKGVLMLRADRCIVVVSPEAETVIAWPAGFTAVARDGGADVLGADGSVVARTGEEIALGGGEGAVGVTGPCLGGGDPVYAVNQAPPYDRSQPDATPGMWTPVQSAEDLEGTWLATQLGGVDAAGAVDLAGRVLTVDFLRGGRLDAVDGLCNDIESTYDAGPDGEVRIASPSVTAVGCGQGQGWPAAATAIYDARSAQVLPASGDQPRRLRLLGADGALLGEYVERADATPTTWTPVQSPDELYGTWRPVVAMGRSLEGATDLSGSPLSVQFRVWGDGSRLVGNDSGCNSFQADYTAGPDGRFSAGEILWSLVGCPAGESTFPGAFVKDATRVELTSSGPRSVRFLASDGTVLAVFDAQ